MSRLTKNYLTKINSLLDKILKEEKIKILSSAKLIRDSYKKGGQLYIFGTGHSRLLGEEAFHRAGGFAAACPIRDDNLTFKKGAKKATSLERTPNVARKALNKYNITKKDILMIVSNSGVNHAPIEAAIIAVSLGAKIIEKHLTLNKKSIGPDHAASIEPNQFKDMVLAIRSVEKYLGNEEKNLTKSESVNRDIVRKSNVALKNIAKGEKFSEANITTKRPGNGISPMYWEKIIGKKAKKYYKKNDFI